MIWVFLSVRSAPQEFWWVYKWSDPFGGPETPAIVVKEELFISGLRTFSAPSFGCSASGRSSSLTRPWAAPFFFFVLDYCTCGTAWRKRARFFTSLPIAGQRVTCTGGHRHQRRSGYCKSKGLSWTNVAEPYPRQLNHLQPGGTAASRRGNKTRAFPAGVQAFGSRRCSPCRR